MLHLILEHRLREALVSALPDLSFDGVKVLPCPDPAFGDYQTNALIAIAKTRKLNPRALATQAVAAMQWQDICDAVEVAGAGFVNFRVKPAFLEQTLNAALNGEHLFFAKSAQPRTVVIDFSSPNVAKSMHVGHIRSTILGDSLTRALRLLGHTVITDNHIGDWGTQFGKLLVGWKRGLNQAELQRDPISEMERLYKKVNAEGEKEPATLEAARAELVKLQNGDPENIAIWQEMIALSKRQFDAIYQRLGLTFDHTLGESFYNPRLKDVVEQLKSKGIARESEGAAVVFFDDVPELKAHPAIVQKSDGAANYMTTDLATVEYRAQTWQPSEIIYVTGGPQQLHFRQLFAIFRRWQPDCPVKLSHVWFGSILGEDGKPFRTRTGETVKLADLLDEAEERAYSVVSEKNPALEEAERRAIGRAVGLGAIKYADLLPNRQSDYVFSWDKMLALQGNTAPYLQYAYARIQSIFRKAEEAGSGKTAAPVALRAPEELALAKHLARFGLTLEAVIVDNRPNYLCNYLYELAGVFAKFYEACPVLKAEPAERESRLSLCRLTAAVLRQGLGVLGIDAPERM